MKRDRIKTLLLAEALICALLALALWLFEGDAFSVAGFPGSAVGQGLSALAASGRFGFALAFTLYAAVILLPLYALVHIAARRELKPEDALLVLIAFAAACALFPHGWTTYWSTSAEALFPRLAWQWLIFALLAGWVVLRLLRRVSGGDTQELLKLFRALLILAAAYFVFEVCFAEFAGLFSAVDALKAGNTAFTVDTVLPAATDITGSKSLVFSYVVLALRFAAGTDGYFPGDETHPQDFDLIEGNACAISLAKIGNTPWAQCFATFVPDEIPTAHAARFQAQIMAHMSGQAMLNHDRMVNVRSAADIRPALKDGKVACIHTIENATFFAEDPALIEVLKSLGVLMSSLSWNAQGPLASGHDTHAGLTAAGIEALTQMEHAGMVLDVSHLNDECFDEVVAHATRPFVASHSNSRAVCGVKRNLTDDQFRTIRDMGGIVGLNYCSEFLSNDATDKTAADVTFDQLAAHIEHWLDLGGEDVIALGGDWDGATVPAFLSDASKMPEFQNILSKHFGKTVMQKLCSDNALAFFERY